jgi:hypothetical protein
VSAGTVVTAIIQGYGYTTTVTFVGSSSMYSVLIPVAQGISYVGQAVTFMIGNVTAVQVSAWILGGNTEVDLTANTT